MLFIAVHLVGVRAVKDWKFSCVLRFNNQNTTFKKIEINHGM